MNKCTNKYLLDNFKLYYPMITDEAVEFYDSGTLRVVAVLEDGSRYEYDELYSSIRRLNKIDECGYEELDDELWKNQFSINLRRTSALRGISQEELSELTGISKVSICHYATGQKVPSAWNLRKIAKALQCRTDDLIGF